MVRTAYGGGVRTPEHHSDSLEGLLMGSPGVKVVVPSTPLDAAGLLLAAIDDPDPVVMMEPIRLYRAVARGAARRAAAGASWARRACGANGTDVTLVAWGAVVPPALEAAELVSRPTASRSKSIDPRTLSPLDWDTLVGSVDKTGRLVVAHEAPRTGGPGGEAGRQPGRALLLRAAQPAAARGWRGRGVPAAVARGRVPARRRAHRRRRCARRWTTDRWPFEFKLPDLGEGIHEAQVLAWKVTPGQEVAAFQPLCEVESAKAAVELTAPVAGRVRETRFAEGDIAHLGDVLVVIDTDTTATAVRHRARPPGRSLSGSGSSVRHPEPPTSPGHRRRRRANACAPRHSSASSPAIWAYRSRTSRARGRTDACGSPTSRRARLAPAPAKTTIPLRGLRKSIADHMVAGLAHAPQVTSMDLLDVTELVRARDVAARPATGAGGAADVPAVLRQGGDRGAAKRCPSANAVVDER